MMDLSLEFKKMTKSIRCETNQRIKIKKKNICHRIIWQQIKKL